MYRWTVAEHGVEMGFGRGGHYAAHAHGELVDVIFSVQGMEVVVDGGRRIRGNLLVVWPETWYGPVQVGEFWFLKFFTRNGPMVVPDKITSRSTVQAYRGGGIVAVQGTGELSLPLVRRSPRSSPENAVLSIAAGGECMVVLGGLGAFSVCG